MLIDRLPPAFIALIQCSDHAVKNRLHRRDHQLDPLHIECNRSSDGSYMFAWKRMGANRVIQGGLLLIQYDRHLTHWVKTHALSLLTLKERVRADVRL